jgi:predicted PurR-regulated permease PerM
MKKGFTILVLCMMLIVTLSIGAFANPLTNATNTQKLINQTSNIKASTPLPNDKVQSTSNINPAPMNEKANPATNSSRWSRFKSYFHDRVIQPVKLGWNHLKSLLHKNKTVSENK